MHSYYISVYTWEVTYTLLAIYVIVIIAVQKFSKIVIKLLYSNNPDVHWTRYVHLYILLKQSNI